MDGYSIAHALWLSQHCTRVIQLIGNIIGLDQVMTKCIIMMTIWRMEFGTFRNSTMMVAIYYSKCCNQLVQCIHVRKSSQARNYNGCQRLHCLLENLILNVKAVCVCAMSCVSRTDRRVLIRKTSSSSKMNMSIASKQISLLAVAVSAVLVACNAAYTSAPPAPPILHIDSHHFTEALRLGNASAAAEVLVPAIKQSA